MPVHTYIDIELSNVASPFTAPPLDFSIHMHSTRLHPLLGCCRPAVVWGKRSLVSTYRQKETERREIGNTKTDVT